MLYDAGKQKITQSKRPHHNKERGHLLAGVWRPCAGIQTQKYGGKESQGTGQVVEKLRLPFKGGNESQPLDAQAKESEFSQTERQGDGLHEAGHAEDGNKLEKCETEGAE